MNAKEIVVGGDVLELKDAEARDLLGSETLDTEATTVTGAINELNSNLDAIQPLWNNPNSGASFASQDVAVSESIFNYKFIFIKYRSKTTSSAYTSIFVPSTMLLVNTVGYSFFGGTITSRACKTNSNGTILTFTDASNTAVDNTLAVPEQIIGFMKE